MGSHQGMRRRSFRLKRELTAHRAQRRASMWWIAPMLERFFGE
jgi:hypothetical protein